MKFNFNAIANAISVASGVTLAGIIGVGSYVYLNKDAIIEAIKEQAIESVMGGLGTGAAGGALKALPGADLPLGTNDLPAAAPDQAAVPAPQAPVQF